MKTIVHLTFLFLMGFPVLVCAEGFDFNNGTVQGWTLDGAYDEDGDGPFANNYSASFSWKDPVNYPVIPGSDPIGNNNGSIQMFGSAHGINNPGATWWVMKFTSPDLSGDPMWQSATGFTVKIAECMVALGKLYANLFVKVYNHDLGTDQYFYNGTAQQLTHCIYGSQNIWNTQTLVWSAIPNFPKHYTIKNVYVYIWGKMSGDAYEGGLYIDEVQPICQTPAAPSNLDVNLLPPQLHVTWQDNSTNETGFRIEYKDSVYPVWQLADNVPANTTSYQFNGSITGRTYYFRVRAFNDCGSSDWSNEDSIYNGNLLIWICITSPNGGENWAAGSTKTLTWQTGTFSPPAFVNLYYSTDGGSNWTTIATNIANTGSYSWTVPMASTPNARIKVASTSGSPYDISDASFTISYRPDLIVESIEIAPEKPRIGQWITVKVKVKNQGQAAAGAFWVAWYDQPNPPTLSQSGLQEQVTSLAAGSSYTMTKTMQVWQPHTMTMWAQVDIENQVVESNESNNIFGPQYQDVVEFEWSFEQTGLGAWFGGDNRPEYIPVNVGGGQSITLPFRSIVRYVAFNFLEAFDYYQNPEGIGHPVTLTLNCRKADGQILSTSQKTVPASFNGGWVYFDLNQYVCANQTYIYTCYLPNGETLGLMNMRAEAVIGHPFIPTAPIWKTGTSGIR